MEFQKPSLAYTAEDNIEAQSVAQMLIANNVAAYAVEDNAGASLFGSLTQDNPKVFVEEADLQKALELVAQFTENKVAASKSESEAPARPILAECEECNASSVFPGEANGTTQICPKCQAYMDVGDLGWGEMDFGESAESE